jgi:hypothetical protein
MFWKRSRTCLPSAPVGKAADFLTPDSTLDGDHEDAGTIPGKDPDFGTSTTIKTFYEGKNSHPNNYNWVETPPKQLNVKIAKANNRVAIKLFKIKDHEQPTMSGKTPLKIHMVELQSALLVSALKGIVKDEDMFLETTEPGKEDWIFHHALFQYF